MCVYIYICTTIDRYAATAATANGGAAAAAAAAATATGAGGTQLSEGVVEEDMSLYTRLNPTATFSSTPTVRVAISVTLLDHTIF